MQTTSNVAAFPDSQHAVRRLAAVNLRTARQALDTAERHLDDVVLGLIAGASELSIVDRRSQAAIREARENVFAARRSLDQIRLGLLAPDADTLTPNDEEDMATALQACLVGNEAARINDAAFDRLTPACVGVRTGW
ncbi:hypothetical protein [Methylobacterium aquaticum]|uniref:Uncharacterized protein n=1 Tax=Methylobacterium aquaticum TaxID=270351 RepID=A0A0C6FB07_9HYPH|nr:hypothetical protein [Methylobacterium aquaticum]BAQ44002.1 hypothetical protein Maq22A_c02690 [Methylobacterium aquaticum]